jgi:hypothetical protein
VQGAGHPLFRALSGGSWDPPAPPWLLFGGVVGVGVLYAAWFDLVGTDEPDGAADAVTGSSVAAR